ncbi:MAG: hypothetical protein ACQEQL_00255 [Pseudomonadota bacterium]
MAVAFQETLALILLAMIFGGVALAGAYVLVLNCFFKELREREPEVHQKIGNPGLTNMVFLPFIKFRKFYAFYPVLKQRRHSDYKYAGKAYLLLNLGLGYCAVVFLVVIAQIAIL